MPPEVAASSGLDVLSHAIESFTAIPYTSRPYPASPGLRPAYQGSNPISDIWALQALRIVAQYLVRAVDDPSDDEARAQMMLAASYAGVGFGNAGVHLPHGMSYPVSGHVKDFRAPGYPGDHPLVPHGISVILNAPAVFRFTAAANPVATPARGRGPRCRRHGREGRRCRNDSRGPHHLVHAAAWRAQWVEGSGLHLGRHSRPRRGNAAAAPRHEAVASTGWARRTGRALRRARWSRGDRRRVTCRSMTPLLAIVGGASRAARPQWR